MFFIRGQNCVLPLCEITILGKMKLFQQIVVEFPVMLC